MIAWTCSLGWFRFTVPDSKADEVIALVGGDWNKDKKGFLGYRQGWLSREGLGGLGRIARRPAGRLVKCMWICPKS
jgi:phage replication initiation protein